MKAIIGYLTFIAVIWTLLSPEAIAQDVRHAKPKWGEHRLDWCLNWARNCGEAAAQAWCQAMGYDKATHWKKTNNIGSQSPTVIMREKKICRKKACDGFTEITCSGGGDRVDEGDEGKADQILEWAIVRESENRCHIEEVGMEPSSRPSGTLETSGVKVKLAI
jgi:hypothetical protein